MLVIPSLRGPFRDHLVFFADAADVEGLESNCGRRDVYRFRHAAASASAVDALHDGPSCTTCVDLRPPLDDVLRTFDAKSCRYELRRAEKLGDRVRITQDDAQTVQDFMGLYRGFLERSRHARPLRRGRLDRYLRGGNVFVAYLDDAPVVGHVLIVDRPTQRARLTFSASTRLDPDRGNSETGPVNRWLHWHEMRHYQSNGVQTYDFGGVNPASPKARFKMSFGGQLEEGRNLVIAGSVAGRALRLAGASSGDFRRRTSRSDPVRAS